MLRYRRQEETLASLGQADPPVEAALLAKVARLGKQDLLRRAKEAAVRERQVLREAVPWLARREGRAAVQDQPA